MADSLFDPSRIYNALKEAESLPTWVKSTFGGFPQFNATTNEIQALPPESRSTKSSLAHELSHAVQYNLLIETARKIAQKKYNKESVSKQEEQFLDSLQKLMGDQGRYGPLYDSRTRDKDNKSLSRSIDALYGDRKDSFDYYRTKPTELQAFGVGSMTEGGLHPAEWKDKKAVQENYKPHLDPSYATEFDILLTMYEQLPKELRSPPVQSKKATEQTFDFVNMNEDPFKPTIK